MYENVLYSSGSTLQFKRVFFYNIPILFSVDNFILVENAVGSLEKVGIKRNEKGIFDDWKLEMVR